VGSGGSGGSGRKRGTKFMAENLVLQSQLNSTIQIIIFSYVIQWKIMKI
jgi:hypothetical protein